MASARKREQIHSRFRTQVSETMTQASEMLRAEEASLRKGSPNRSKKQGGFVKSSDVSSATMKT